jgi:hypothetical protein
LVQELNTRAGQPVVENVAMLRTSFKFLSDIGSLESFVHDNELAKSFQVKIVPLTPDEIWAKLPGLSRSFHSNLAGAEALSAELMRAPQDIPGAEAAGQAAYRKVFYDGSLSDVPVDLPTQIPLVEPESLTPLPRDTLSHDELFLDQAITHFINAEIRPTDESARTYQLEPGTPLHPRLLNFFIEELEQLPWHNEVGVAIDTRDGANTIIRQITTYLKQQAQHPNGWGAEKSAMVPKGWEDWLALFKSEIYSHTQQNGIAYNVYFHRDWKGGLSLVLERYFVQQEPVLKVGTNGSLVISLDTGLITVITEMISVANVHNVPAVPAGTVKHSPIQKKGGFFAMAGAIILPVGLALMEQWLGISLPGSLYTFSFLAPVIGLNLLEFRRSFSWGWLGLGSLIEVISQLNPGVRQLIFSPLLVERFFRRDNLGFRGPGAEKWQKVRIPDGQLRSTKRRAPALWMGFLFPLIPLLTGMAPAAGGTRLEWVWILGALLSILPGTTFFLRGIWERLAQSFAWVKDSESSLEEHKPPMQSLEALLQRIGETGDKTFSRALIALLVPKAQRVGWDVEKALQQKFLVPTYQAILSKSPGAFTVVDATPLLKSEDPKDRLLCEALLTALAANADRGKRVFIGMQGKNIEKAKVFITSRFPALAESVFVDDPVQGSTFQLESIVEKAKGAGASSLQVYTSLDVAISEEDKEFVQHHPYSLGDVIDKALRMLAKIRSYA